MFLPENSWAAGLHFSVVTRWNRSTCIASWEMGSFSTFASRETSRSVLQAVINQGGLILMLASGFSTRLKDARDLTFTYPQTQQVWTLLASLRPWVQSPISKKVVYIKHVQIFIYFLKYSLKWVLFICQSSSMKWLKFFLFTSFLVVLGL
jgi:hypothetical protein